MPVLSKSRLLAFRQCPKRLWLEVHRPQLRQDSSATQANFATGHEVGDLARRLYDLDSDGVFLDRDALTLDQQLNRTHELLKGKQRIFEAGFRSGTSDNGVLAIADILEPAGDGQSWNMVEVKSSTSVKDYYLDDTAIQYHAASQAGVRLASLHLAYIDSSWVYPGGGDYSGLLVEEDVTEQARSRQGEVREWLTQAHRVVALSSPPEREIGGHCAEPYECSFAVHCRQEHDQRYGAVQHPIEWLPGRRSKALSEHISAFNARSMSDVPDTLLNASQLRVKTQTVAGRQWFDREGAALALATYRMPALFLDFETIAFAVPRWAGTRPYQQIPFQFSLHRLGRGGAVSHIGFLDLSGGDPSEGLARALIQSCGTNEPIFAYNKGFEGARINELAQRFPRLRKALEGIRDRLVDLLPVANKFYYHPAQQGSWSIKKVLPTIAPELDYAGLEEVQDGGQAQMAYLEAVATGTSVARRKELDERLWKYCRLDTFAMVRLWAFFAGRDNFTNSSDVASSNRVGVGQ